MEFGELVAVANRSWVAETPVVGEAALGKSRLLAGYIGRPVEEELEAGSASWDSRLLRSLT